MTRIEEEIKKFVKKEFDMTHVAVAVGNKSKTLNSLILEFLELQRMKSIVDGGEIDADFYKHMPSPMLDKLQKVIDCIEGKVTSQDSPLDQLKRIVENRQASNNLEGKKKISLDDIFDKNEQFKLIEFLQHHYDFTIGLWCTDSPEVIPENKKEYFFQIEKDKEYKNEHRDKFELPEELNIKESKKLPEHIHIDYDDPFRKHDLQKSFKEISQNNSFEEELNKSIAEIEAMKIQTGCLMCVCSYINKRTMERNYMNILLKQDQFPNIKQCQEAIEEKKGFGVTGVVLVNWKEVNNDYEL